MPGSAMEVPPSTAQLNLPWDVVVDGAGNLFIADLGHNRVRKVAPSGIITTVAGNGAIGFSGDDGPATNASLNQPRGIEVDGAGNLFIADALNFRIRKVSSDGIITTVAGDAWITADGATATSTHFDFATRVVADRAGNLFIADGSRVRKVSSDGIVTTVAGNGTFTGNMLSGDGGPATNAQLYPLDLAADGAGNLFIRISRRDFLKFPRRYFYDGCPLAFRRSPFPFPSGDGGPAIGARFGVGSVAVDRAGNVFIAGTSVRKVSPAGIITTVAAVEGGALATDGAGNLFIARVQVVRKISPDGIYHHRRRQRCIRLFR